MKRFGLLAAIIAMAMSVSAQTVTESKTFDNFYIGVNGGVATATKGHMDGSRTSSPMQVSASAATSLRYSEWLSRAMLTSRTPTVIQQEP